MPRQRKFRVWCENNKEWEKDTTILHPNGNLYDVRHGFILNSDTHIIEDYVEALNAYEGDILVTEESDSWEIGRTFHYYGEVKYNEDKGRIMVYDEIDNDWYECDDYLFDEVCGNIHQGYRNPKVNVDHFTTVKLNMEDFFND